jgi:hypothetical protein
MKHSKRSFFVRFFLGVLTSLFFPFLVNAGIWRSEIRLTHIPGQSWEPRIAAYNGALHVVWFEYPSFVDPEIYYSRSTDNGNSWSTPQNISNRPTQKDLYPSVAADAYGVYVVWSSDTEDVEGEVFFKRSTDGGVAWSNEQQLSNAPGYSRASDILVDQQGNLHIVWWDDRNGYSGVYHRQSCDHGVTWTAEQWVTQFDGVVDNEDPKIAQAENGTLYLLFRSSRDGEPQGGWPPYGMYLLRSQSSGCPSGTAWLYPAQRISYGLPDEYSNNYSGTVSVGKNGRLHIAYWDEKRGTEVIYRRGLPTAGGWSKPVIMSSFGLSHPEAERANRPNPGLVEDDANGVRVFFSQNAAVRDTLSVGSLFYRGSDDSGLNWNVAFQLGTGSVATSPQGVYQNGRVHVVWTDFRDGNYGSEIYYRMLELNLTSLVDHYYTSILKRSPDSSGKRYWEGEIERTTSLGIDVKEAYRVMSGNFFNSGEYYELARKDSEFVTDLYLTFFNRSPDTEGLNFWLGHLSSGLSRDMVMYFFVFSPEFNYYMTGLYGDTSTRADLYALVDFYRGILNRLPEDEGFSYWLTRFRTAQCIGPGAVTEEVETISRSFFLSDEYAARRRDNAQFIQDLYYTFMRRYANVSEVNYWVNELNTGAKTREQLRQYFIQSPEFQARVNAMINEGCLQ